MVDSQPTYETSFSKIPFLFLIILPLLLNTICYNYSLILPKYLNSLLVNKSRGVCLVSKIEPGY